MFHLYRYIFFISNLKDYNILYREKREKDIKINIMNY